MKPPRLIEVIEDLPEEEYHQRPELSSHDLKDYIHNPLRFYRTKIAKDLEIPNKRTPDLEFGTLVHEIMKHGGDWQRFVVEEPRGFEEHKFDKDLVAAVAKGQEIAVEPPSLVEQGRNRKAYQTWKKEQLERKAVIAPTDFDRGLYAKYAEFIGEFEGKTIIKAGRLNPYREIVETMEKDKYLEKRLHSTVAKREITIIWEHHTGIKCRSRLDYFSNIIIDWKTILSVAGAVSHIMRFGYDFSAAFYQLAGFALAGKLDIPFMWVFLEKVPAFAYRKIDAEQWLPTAHEEIEHHMTRLASEDFERIYNRPIEVLPPPTFRKSTIFFEE